MTIIIQNQEDIYSRVTCPDKEYCKLLDAKIKEARLDDGSIAMKDIRRIYTACSIEGNIKYCPTKKAKK